MASLHYLFLWALFSIFCLFLSVHGEGTELLTSSFPLDSHLRDGINSIEHPQLVRCYTSPIQPRAVISPPAEHSPPTTMTPFSILPIISYTLLALALSYAILRLVRRFRGRLFSRSPPDRLPIPNGAMKSTSKGWVQWSPSWNWDWDWLKGKGTGTGTTLKKRGLRPLHLHSVELLPTAMTPSTASLVDVPSSSSTIIGTFHGSSNVGSGKEFNEKHYLQLDQEPPLLSRSSSLEALPSLIPSPAPSSTFSTQLIPHPHPHAYPLSAPPTSITPNFPLPLPTPSLTANSSASSYTRSPQTPPIPFQAPAPVAQHGKQATLNGFKFPLPLPSVFALNANTYPRSPSPQFPHPLATSPPSKHQHRRSRSLGGVPLRRLSGSRLLTDGRPVSPLASESPLLDVEMHHMDKGKGKEKAFLIDFSSSSSSENSISDSLPSSNVGIISREPSTASSDIGGRVGYGPLIPVPVPLLDLEDDNDDHVVVSPHVWTFDFNDREKDVVGNGEMGLIEVRSEAAHVVSAEPEHREEEEDTPLATLQRSLVDQGREKLVDVESESEADVGREVESNIASIAPHRKLVEIDEAVVVEMHLVRIERDSWNWDDIEAGAEEEEDPWAQHDREMDMDLIRFEQEEQGEVEEDPFRDPEEAVEVREPLYVDDVREVEEEVDSRAIVEAQQAAVLELVQELATASLPGLEGVLLVLPDAEDVGEDTASPSPRYLDMGAEVEVNEMDAEQQGEEEEEGHSVDFDQTLVEIVPLPLEKKDKPLFSDNPIVKLPIPVQPPALDSKHVSLDPILATAIPDAVEPDTKHTLVEPSFTSLDVIVQRSEILEDGALTSTGSQSAQTWLDDTPPSKSTVDFPSPSAVAEQSSITTIHDFNETYDDPPTPTLPLLPPLTIPLITISSAGYLDDNQYPDPDFLPLPENLSALLSNVDQSLSSDKWEMKEPWDEGVIPKEPLSQMPTPPASPPMMPRSIPGSPRREKEKGDRPAWSVRASDAPALGLSAASSVATSPVSPTLRARSRLDDKEKEKEEEQKAVDEPPEEERMHSIIEETQDSTQAEKIKEATKSDVPVSLPGTFPEPTNLLPNSTTPPPTTTSPTTAASNSDQDQVQTSKVIAATAPLSARQRTPRSPIDIALAMQLRPGLGLGADPAWMVRFLMSMWGWFAIMISGSNEFR